ncbi:MAG TPA: hypothetical protein VJX23_07035 [Candidatus Binataceae bacterium]|nr:hypothetical protein [Candidatus Binataceae bacterium]
MKSIQDEKSLLLGTAKTPHESGRHIVSDDLKERLETDVVVSAGFAVIVALCVVMFVGLYRWSRYAPIFPPDGAAGPAIEETIPWSG